MGNKWGKERKKEEKGERKRERKKVTQNHAERKCGQILI